MKKKIHITLFLIVLCLLSRSNQLFAQSPDDQLLIFRNTGVTNLLYQSEIDSIIFTKIDTLGVEYEAPVGQVFYTPDTTLYVAIAEIDSVCLGSRNEIEFRTDVRIMADDTDMQWIIGYDGYNIYYELSTPTEVLPTVNQKLYYSEFTELFPFGLCVKVDKVERGGDVITVAVSPVDAAEIFKKFFYAGSMEGMEENVAKAQRHRAEEIETDETIKLKLDMGVGSLGVEGNLGVRFDNIVIDVFRHYYHADICIPYVFGFYVKAKSLQEVRREYERDFLHIPLPTIAAILHPSVDVGLFAEIDAELSLEYEMARRDNIRFEWTRNQGRQTFVMRNPTRNGVQENQAKTQIMLDGSVFGGVQMKMNLNLVGDVVGAQASVKIGPEYRGELSMMALRDLSKDFDLSIYGRAELSLGLKLQFKGSLVHRDYIFGAVKVTPIVEYKHTLFEGTIGLFPNFYESRAVLAPSRTEVSVSVKSKNEIAYDVETGFQIVESPSHPIPLDSVFVKDIKEGKNGVVQGVNAIFDIQKGKVGDEGVFVRPVFHYAGYTIPYAIIDASQNPNIQPAIFWANDVDATVVSGTPIVDNVVVDKTLYIIGPYIMVPANDPVFHDESPFVCTIRSIGFVNNENQISLMGMWDGECDGESISILFSENGLCNFACNDYSFTDVAYRVNYPQSGCILIDTEDESIVFDILSLTKSTLELRFKNTIHKGKICKMRRNNGY